MSAYIDKIMSNHVFNSESSEDMTHLFSEEDIQQGGVMARVEQYNDINKDDKPNGGFPPIFIRTSKEKVREQSQNRLITSRKTAVSIRDILKSKKLS